MNSSSESIPALVVVTGVGGAAIEAVEATDLLLGCSSNVEESIVASVAFLFFVEGEMVKAFVIDRFVVRQQQSVIER